jgi:hypothetical protein
VQHYRNLEKYFERETPHEFEECEESTNSKSQCCTICVGELLLPTHDKEHKDLARIAGREVAVYEIKQTHLGSGQVASTCNTRDQPIAALNLNLINWSHPG